MKFCPECNNILYPREDKENHVLLYKCQQCEFAEEADTSIVYRNIIKHTESEKTFVVYDVTEDPTLPRVRVPCPNCGHHEAVFFQTQTTDENEGMEVQYICTTCRHRWKE